MIDMEEILILIENLLKSSKEETGLQKQLYTKLSNYRLTENDGMNCLVEDILPKIHLLCRKHVLKKDILYLSLISYNNFDILKKCMEYDKIKFELNIRDHGSLYDYSIFERQHWFYEILKKRDNHKYFKKRASQKMLILKLIEVTNIQNIQVKQIKLLLEDVDLTNIDVFWKFYVKKVEYLTSIIDFCKYTVHATDLNEMFVYMSQHCVLESFSKYLDLSTVEWSETLKKIHEEEELDQNTSDIQSQHFVAFYILGSIFKFIFPATKINVHEIFEDLKTKIFCIKSKLLQIELLENIFAVLFFRTNHVIDNQIKEQFVCKEKEIRLILNFLKTIIDYIKFRIPYGKKTEEYARFNDLNKFVADALWRIELIENVKSAEKCKTNLLRYLLAPPSSLIQMCIKQGDFKRAYQVIHIFGLEEDFLYTEIKYLEKLQLLRKDLKTACRVWEIKKEVPSLSISEINLSESIKMFFINNPLPFHSEIEQTIGRLSKRKQFFVHLKNENEAFMNMFDLAITQLKYFEHNASMINLAFDNENMDKNVYSSYKEFCTKLFELFKEIRYERNVTLSDIITSLHYSLDKGKFKKEEEFYVCLTEFYEEFNNDLNTDESGGLNSDHSSHRSLLKLNSLCSEFVEYNHGNKDSVKYIGKLYKYLKAFSKVLYIEQDSSNIVSHGKNTAYFSLLYYNRSELIGKLLFERHLDPSEFEKYFAKLELDYLYHVIGNCFPTINLHSEESITKEELYPENSLYIPSKSIITYIQQRNWLLAFILSEMHNVRHVKIDINEIRVRPFLNYMKLSKIQSLKVLFGNNEIVTALQNKIGTQKVSQYINMRILRNEMWFQHSHHSNDSFETAQEILEDGITTTNWRELLNVIQSIREDQLRESPVLVELKDMILVNLVQDRFDVNDFKYVQFITEEDLRVTTILYNIKQWPGEFCIDVITSEITKFQNIRNVKISDLKLWLEHIQLCEELKEVLGVSSWSEAYDISEIKPTEIIRRLISSDKIHILLQFIELHKPKKSLLLEINENYFMNIFYTVDSYKPVKTLLDSLPYNHSIKVCYNLLNYLTNLDSLQFVADYLSNSVTNDLLKNVQISLKMISTFTRTEQECLLSLIYDPMDIVEVLIMNAKLDKLPTVLDIIRAALDSFEFDKNQLYIERIDEMLRNYAEKSLDFRVIAQPNPRLLRTPECNLMQSIDSLTLDAGSRGFVMPEEVPAKDKWVQNNEVLECMCCHKITFSMFNRRHHCRRCGRVVCYNCSTRRMPVPTYGHILVRICEDCYHQAIDGCTSSDYDTISIESVASDYWYLTNDVEHNKIVREEFSYEHAPSASLCLSIMKYHSKSIEYPKFLLDQCDAMLRLLRPNQEPIQEIDCSLVIKMLKSLAVAAKTVSTECAFQYGASSADNMLSQAELLGLLAERGCLSLLPVSNTQQSSFIDASMLRKLKDKLLEREQWNLALEVSTKAGLDTTGIFATWGKSCLKAGSLVLARQKFHRCFHKNGHYENISSTNSQSDTSQDSVTKMPSISKSLNLGIVLEMKPLINPPLLNEIICILESKTVAISSEIVKTVEDQVPTNSSLNQHLDAAVCIRNKLINLKNIADGNYYQALENDGSKIECSTPPIDNMFYNECVYYLTKYGTHVSLLEFYIRHGDISTALNYIIDGQLSTHFFIDIYMRYLKDGRINILQEHMSRIDSTLSLWKDYLQCLCRYLEKNNLLHSLYQLQQFMGDYIRAAMMCIRFYQEDSNSFTHLFANANFLYEAERYLKKGLVQDYEEKHLANPSLVMQMSSKDVNRNIETIWRQKEVALFLAECEALNMIPVDVLSDISRIEMSQAQQKSVNIPTLFGSTQEKIQLAILAIICGRNIEDGFNIALNIVQTFNLKPEIIFCEAGKQLTKAERYTAIGQLVTCIKESGMDDVTITNMCDKMLTPAVSTFTKTNVSGAKVEDLIKLISDRAAKISAYIVAKQLKTAYVLAVKYKRVPDIRRILKEAELSNQPNIKALCQKVLLSHSEKWQSS